MLCIFSNNCATIGARFFLSIMTIYRRPSPNVVVVVVVVPSSSASTSSSTQQQHQNRAEDCDEEEVYSRDEEGQHVFQSLSPD